VDLLERTIEALLNVKQEFLKELRELSNDETQLWRSVEAETGSHAFLPTAVMLSFFIVGSLVLVVIFGPWFLLALAVMIGSFIYGGASVLEDLLSSN
jgi:fatty acid desaturase